MFCYQCEQTQHIDAVAGCHSQKGTCGKDSVTSDLQDILIHAVKGLAQVSHKARALGVTDAAVDDFIHYALFTTLTNVNFNPVRIEQLVRQAVTLRDGLNGKAAASAPRHSPRRPSQLRAASHPSPDAGRSRISSASAPGWKPWART